MMRLNEEEKALLCQYEGGRMKVIRELKKGMDELKEDAGNDEIIGLMDNLVQHLSDCSNRDFFRFKEECLINDATDVLLEE